MLRPGGRLELAVWDRIEVNDFGLAVAAAMADLFPDDPPAFLERMPYSYHDRDVIVADLAAGGSRRRARSSAWNIGSMPRRPRWSRPRSAVAPPCATNCRQVPTVSRVAIAGAASALADRFGTADLTGRTAALVTSAMKG